MYVRAGSFWHITQYLLADYRDPLTYKNTPSDRIVQ